MQNFKERGRPKREPVKDCLIGILLACCPNELPNIREALLVIGLESALMVGKRNM